MTQKDQLFVGREKELRRLDGFLEHALAGTGQVCFITGEAGAGKSSLSRQFTRRAQARHDELLVAFGDCNAQTGAGDPYLPFREILAQLAGDVEPSVAEGVITEENADRLKDFLRVSGEVIADVGADLIGVFIPGASLLARLGARLVRRPESVARDDPQKRLVEQYTNVIRTLATHRPLILWIDDLHWADNASLELLFHLARRIEGSRVMILGTYREADVALGREGERHPLEPVVAELKRYYGDAWVDIGGGNEREGRAFVEALIDSEPNELDEAFREALFRHTEGHPLFTAELLADLKSQGTLARENGSWVVAETPVWEELPSRVEGVIEERVGRLEEPLQATLRVASVEGESFTAEVVADVQRADQRELVRQISGELDRRHRLVGAQGRQRVGERRISLYRFRHSLFQKYLYGQLDAVERSHLHEDVGLALEQIYGGRSGDIAVQLARHFERAGDTGRVASYRKQAGDAAMRVYAYAEARTHYNRALEALDDLPDTHENARTRIDVVLCLVRAAYVSDSPEENLQRLESIEPLAAELPDRAHGPGGGIETQAWIHYWMGRFHFLRNAPRDAIGYYQRVLAVADQLDNQELIAIPSSVIGRALCSQGNFTRAEPLLRQALDPLEATGNLPEWIQSIGFLGVAIAGCGDYAAGLATGERGLDRAREIESKTGTALSHVYLWAVHFLGGRVDRMIETADDAVECARQAGDKMTEYVGLGFKAWSEVRAGRPSLARETMDRCEALGQTLGERLVVADWFAAARAEIALALGQTSETCRLAEEAVEMATAMGGVFAEGFARRTWARAVAAGGRPAEEVDTHLQGSLDAFESGGVRPEMARTHVAWAELLRARGESRAAVEHLEAAARIFDDTGLQAELEQVEDALEPT